jgi:hypothetical protein
MKKVIAILLLCLSTQAFAMTVGGVKLADKIHLGKNDLILNGAGLRTKYILSIYVGALYLKDKEVTAEAVLADTGAKRVELHILHHLSAGDFMEAFNKAIKENLTTEEYVAVAVRLLRFSTVFREVGEVEKGSLIFIDYLPDDGMVLTVNGKELTRIKGEDFYRAMLKIWMGNKPVQESLKKGMLGG